MTTQITYGSKTALANNSATNLDTSTATHTLGFGKIAATGAIDYHIHLAIPVATAATDGDTWDLYLAESHDDTEWSIASPTSTVDQSAELVNGRLIAVYDAGGTASGSATDHMYFNVGDVVSMIPAYFGFFLKNNTGQTATVGFDADYIPMTYATV
jgi:hypothetical protein